MRCVASAKWRTLRLPTRPSIVASPRVQGAARQQSRRPQRGYRTGICRIARVAPRAAGRHPSHRPPTRRNDGNRRPAHSGNRNTSTPAHPLITKHRFGPSIPFGRGALYYVLSNHFNHGPPRTEFSDAETGHAKIALQGEAPVSALPRKPAF